MKFNRCEFYHWQARFLLLDLAGSGCETQFIWQKTVPQASEPDVPEHMRWQHKERKTLAQRTQRRLY
jgi:hypothetical protein